MKKYIREMYTRKMSRINELITNFTDIENLKNQWKNKNTIEQVLVFAIILIMALKPISDMFYATHLLDIVLLAMAVLAALVSLSISKFRLSRVDIVPLLWGALCCISLLMSGENTIWFTWIKVVSVFPIYVLGKQLTKDDEKILLAVIQLSLLVVLVTNLIALLMGQGYKEWAQGAQTFAGMYYFKTDLALAMAQVILFFLISKKLTFCHYIIIIIAAVLALLTNSRIYFAIILMLIAICGVYAHKNGKKINFIKTLGTTFLIITVSIVLIIGLAKIPFFAERNFISFTTEGSVWDMLIYNLMYRNVIWRDVLEYFFQADTLHILFGKGFTIDIPWYDAHSIYVTIIYKFGIIGVFSFCAFVVWAWRVIRDNTDGLSYFLNIGLWIILLVAGVSYTTGESTQYTWLVAMFCGCANGRKQKPNNIEDCNCSVM